MQQNGDNFKASRRWFRFYAEALDDPKVQLLSPTLFRTWVNLLCIACGNEGKLPAVSALAFKLRMSCQDTQSHIDELVLAGLLDPTATGLEPHNWKSRQYVSDSSADRVRKHRQNKVKRACNVTRNDIVAPPDTETETDTDTEADIPHPSEQVAARATVGGHEDPFFEKCKSALNGTTDRAIDIVRNADGPYGTKSSAAQWLAELIDDTSPDAVVQAIRFVEVKRDRREPVTNPKAIIAKTAQTVVANARRPTEAKRPADWATAKADRGKAMLEWLKNNPHQERVA